ncbi:bifunctional 2-polyprenyl-6-hydroxyphenol methylase/3-demethylubiquinol 3-O-methyltransferase UbiG [Candidatus Erwinia haradaeae]|uniref:Ubiquinone biosynthesis O-methyltransferase n=1 Tax=Candidatus Erwinia haradaeae TaxID=1922217 RepID=A0A803FTV8_9GAMM|nr:bifunctional 2-polyprenyl-6-hydroxyphenol methylase/3-demethylubiquinol 3-O-methyltransferase UbiG [Candidatus Erwinia haradaeae]VFP87527.1 Ubiquinone biosynthesis O-methyltransferase [Candidatus Erwinia haradaeae]
MHQIPKSGGLNIDYTESAKFAIMASRWWDLEGECKLLHSMNPIRLNWIIQHSSGLFGKKVLDIGCGGGIFTESMANEGANVTGLDIEKDILQVARLHALESGVKVHYIQQTAEEHLVQHSKEYEVVTCLELLEHIPDPYSVIHACSQLVKPGGEVFFSTINRTKISWFVAIFCAEYILRLLPRGTHRMMKFIQPSELLDWIDTTKLHSYHMTGICYNPLTQFFKLTSNVGVNYMVHAHKELGC